MGGLFKSLKKIGSLLGVQSAIQHNDIQRQDSDPSRSGRALSLAHCLTSPELSLAVNSPQKTSFVGIPFVRPDLREVRCHVIGVLGSPETEPHSPCSPFPATARCLTSEHRNSRDFSVRAEGSDIRCNVLRGVASVLNEQQQPIHSPVAVCSPLNNELSLSSSRANALERVDEKPSAPAPVAVEPPAPQTPAPAPAIPASLPVPATTLLAINPALPSAMRRRTWCLEDYNVAKRLYKGGSASVYKATCLRSGLPVALKVYFLTRVPRNVLHMVKREIELHHKLVHPNVIQLYGAFLDGDRIVLVQEYAARGDLFHLLRQLGGRMTEPQVSELVMRPFLEALSYLHSHGICHRDIKPENILYTDKWVLKVADLGVAIDLNQERAVTRAGTVGYMAPEVTRCPLKALPSDNKHDESLAYTSAVDIWATAVLAYELLVGFTPAAARQRFAAGGSGDDYPPAPGSGCPPFPAWLSAGARSFIAQSLAPNPGDRPTAQALLRHPWIGSPPPAASAPVPAAAAAGPQSVQGSCGGSSGSGGAVGGALGR